MIRPVVASDIPAVVELAVVSRLFPEEESATVEALMSDYFARSRDQGHTCLLDVDGRQPVGVVYFQPTPATDRTWHLLMIAVLPGRQGQGRGTALLSQVEDDLRRRQQRLLLVETSGTPDFALTRMFYDRCGYRVDARVRDYYEDGDDMVLYRKDLRATTAAPGATDSENHAGRSRPFAK